LPVLIGALKNGLDPFILEFENGRIIYWPVSHYGKSPNLPTKRDTADAKGFGENPNPDLARLMLVVIEHNEKAGCSRLYTGFSIS